MKKMLMVALETPPCHSISVQRTASFVRSLPGDGWHPVVLSARESVYLHVDSGIDPDWPHGAEIYRAWALDSSRHLAVRGRYWSATEMPDRYGSWLLPALFRGARLIRRYSPKAIWSTYPVATSHWIAGILSTRFGLPWIADFRDPAPFLYDPKAQSSWLPKYIDRLATRQAAALVFTTEMMRQLYLEKYLNLPVERSFVIENGFDEALLQRLTHSKSCGAQERDILLLHSGALYPEGRDPTELIRAMAAFGHRVRPDGNRIKLQFRGAEPTSAHLRLVSELNATEFVEFSQRVPLREAYAEMFGATALILLQDELFKHQIPGKAYEYISSRRPILAITSNSGATGELIRGIESCLVVSNKAADIILALERIVRMPPRTGGFEHLARSVAASKLAAVVAGAVGRGTEAASGRMLRSESSDA